MKGFPRGCVEGGPGASVPNGSKDRRQAPVLGVERGQSLPEPRWYHGLLFALSREAQGVFCREECTVELFLFEGTQSQFERAEEQSALIPYVRDFKAECVGYTVFFCLSLTGLLAGLMVGDMRLTVVTAILAAVCVCSMWYVWSGLSVRNRLKWLRYSGLTPSEQRHRQIQTMVFEGDLCHLKIDGTELGTWDCRKLCKVEESERIFLLHSRMEIGFSAPKGQAGLVLPKACLTDGREAEFRAYLLNYCRKKKIRFYKLESRRLQSMLKQE